MTTKPTRSASNSAAVVQGGAFFGYTGLDRSAPIESLFGPIGDQARLAGNENPFGPAPSARVAMDKTAGLCGFYADRAVFHLIALIAERNNVDPSQVILAAGSTEILCAAALAWGSQGAHHLPRSVLGCAHPICGAQGRGLSRYRHGRRYADRPCRNAGGAGRGRFAGPSREPEQSDWPPARQWSLAGLCEAGRRFRCDTAGRRSL